MCQLVKHPVGLGILGIIGLAKTAIYAANVVIQNKGMLGVKNNQLKLVNFHKNNLDIYLAILLTLIPSYFLILNNFPITHDGFWHLNWAHQWNQQFFGGQFYPRWIEQSFGGLGSPTFSFYPPLLRILSLPFFFFGFTASQKLIGSIIICLFINTIGTLIYARFIFRNKSIYYPLICVIIAAGNPYLIENIFIRGALAEACAMSLIPWVLIGTKISLNSNSKYRSIPLIISYSLLSLSHLPTLLIVSFLYLFYPLIETHFLLKIKALKKYIINIYIPIGLSFFLDGIFLIPAYFDRSLVKISTDPPVEFLTTRFLIDNILGFYPQVAEHAYDRSHLLPIFLWLICIFVFLVILKCLYRKRLTGNHDLKLIIFLYAISLLMNTDLSKPIYFSLPALARIQFPWRFLSVSTELAPFMVGSILLILNETQTRINLNKYIKITINLLLTIVILIGFLGINKYKSINFQPEIMEAVDLYLLKSSKASTASFDSPANQDFHEIIINDKDIWIVFKNNQNEVITVDVLDYLPKQVDLTYWQKTNKDFIYLPKRNYDLIEWEKGRGEVNHLKWSLGFRKFTISTQTESIINLKTLYYPGWKIDVNPVVPTNKSSTEKENIGQTPDGRIQLSLPPGLFNIVLYYQGTRAEQIGMTISIISLVSMVIYFVLLKIFPFS